MTKSLHSLNPLGQREHKEPNTNKLIQLLIRLANSNIGRERRINDASIQKAKTIFGLLTKNTDPKKVREMLRQADDDKIDDEIEDLITNGGDNIEDQRTSAEHAKIVEIELSTALKEQSSALMDKPYVEQKGKNDFLVMKDNVSDPFVTVIPNAIYYDIEKKCTNWLDDCSLDGIRTKLFQAMRSPYK